MRKIGMIIIHCTATPARRNVSVEEIDSWHRRRGFKGIGYHYVIGLDGSIGLGRELELPGAHTLHFNRHSVGVAYVGGLDAKGRPADTRTPAQRKALVRLLTFLRGEFPEARILGHNDLAAKACPCFNAAEEYKDI